MSIDFRIRDYFHPLQLMRLASFLNKSQWYSARELENYQFRRLHEIISHAYENVPYYRNLFDAHGLTPEYASTPEGFKKIPPLTKDTLRKNFSSLTAKNYRKFNPVLCRTSGTSGEPMSLYADKYSNTLEFCYYYRYWSWNGYRLGAPFAEFSLHHFLKTSASRVCEYSSLARQLLLNPAQVSRENISSYIAALRRYKPRFIKGSPSSIYAFCYLLEHEKPAELSFSAVFTTGELLLPHQREKIEKVLHCKVIDSYGHMERTVAVSQCPAGSYHIHSEYGMLELEAVDSLSSPQAAAGTVLGTSLHSFAMPLIRYRIGDIAEIKTSPGACSCGRGLPLLSKIYGRSQGIIVTKDGRLLTNVFIIFQEIEGLAWFQIMQDGLDEFRVRILKGANFNEAAFNKQLAQFKALAGSGAVVRVEDIGHKEMIDSRQKYIPVQSSVPLPFR